MSAWTDRRKKAVKNVAVVLGVVRWLPARDDASSSSLVWRVPLSVQKL